MARPSTLGRPRRLTDRQVAWVLMEYSRYVAWSAQRATVKSQRQLAKGLGVSQGTINLAIRWRGQYKQASPELRSKRTPAEEATKGPDTKGDAKMAPRCPKCGSDNVVVDAAARWSAENQQWEVSDIFDKGHSCGDCGAEDIEVAWVKEAAAGYQENPPIR